MDERPYSKGRYDSAPREAECGGRGIWKGSYAVALSRLHPSEREAASLFG
jgi:endonuclease YncB( thermonuclease family)